MRTIVQAEAPSRPIARGLAGPGLLAHVLVSKYADHLPLYRQSGIYAREGMELERSTLADWVGATSELLKPLNEALRRYLMSARKLHVDDTPVPVLSPGQRRTKLGRLWTYVRDDRPAGDVAAPAVWFTYSPDRRGEHPHRHLAEFRAGCRQMGMPASTGYTTTVTFRRQHAGPMFGASSLTYMRPMLRRSPPKHWDASVLCMR
jgi:hypothetical protein